MPLRPKVWALLCCLVEHPGELRAKRELLELLWPGTTVADNALANCVSDLRQILGDDARDPKFIEIVHRRGYRWIAPLSAPQDSTPATDASLGPDRGIVGRDHEIAELGTLLQRARSGTRQVVFVTGEPGIGKTRLVDAFLEQVGAGAFDAAAADGAVVRWRVGSGQSVEQQYAPEPYLPVFDALSSLCRDPQGGDAVVKVLQRHAPTWLAQMPSFSPAPASLENSVTAGGGLAGSRERMLREMGEAIDALAAQAPLVVVLEDLHWSDNATLDLISYLARRRPQARLLLIGTFRPFQAALDHPLNAIFRELKTRSLCCEIALQYLSSDAIRALLLTRLSPGRLPDELPALIQEHSGGNPLFIVTLIDGLLAQLDPEREPRGEAAVRSMMESIRNVLPDGLRSVIEGQLEAMAGDRLELLETASLIGAEFSAQALAAGAGMAVDEVDRQCEALTQRRIALRSLGTCDWPDGSSGGRYAFVHAMYQRVLRERVAPARRRREHRAIGTRIESAWSGRAEQVCSELAHHFDGAGDRDRAVRYLRESATRAMLCGSLVDAVAAVERALAILESQGETAENEIERVELMLLQGGALMQAHGYADLRAEAVLHRTLTRCDGTGLPLQRFRALLGLFANAYFRGDYRASKSCSDEMMALAAELSLPFSTRAAQTTMAGSCYVFGEFTRARDLIEQAVQIDAPGIPFGRPHAKVIGWTLLGRVQTLLGFSEQGEEAAQAGLQCARELSPFDTTFALYLVAARYALTGQVEAATRAAREAVEVADQFEFRAMRPLAEAMHGWGVAMSGSANEGLAAIRSGMESRHAIGLDGERGWLHWLLATALLHDRRYDDALQTIDSALAWSENLGERWLSADLYRLKADTLCLVGSGSEGEAGALLKLALDIADRQQARWWRVQALTSLVGLGGGASRDDALDRLRAEYEGFSEGTDGPVLRRVRACLARA